MPRLTLFVFMLLTWAIRPALGHHGRDFILVQDSAIPSSLGGVGIAGFEWTRDGDSSEFSSEPGFYLGLAQSLAFGLTSGFADDGSGWTNTGTTPQFILSLLPPTGPLNFRAGLWTGYEFAQDSRHSHNDTAAHTHDTGSGPDAPPPTPHSHSHSSEDHGSHGGGIHRHGENGWHSRLILEADLVEGTRMVLNLVSFVSGDGGKPGFGYAWGLRHEINHDLSVGLEALGDFEERQGSHQVLLTTMVGMPGGFSIRLGVGGGLTPSAPDFTLHSSVLWRF
jgi:hypothetical protein